MKLVFALCVVVKYMVPICAQITADPGAASGLTGAPAGPEVTESPGGITTTFSQSSPLLTEESTAPTSMQLTIASMLAGQYSNIAQYLGDVNKNTTGPNRHTLIQSSYIPIFVQVLSPAVVMYFEQRVNNETKPVRQALNVFSQESPCLVRMSIYDIANVSRFSATPEGFQAMENLRLQELSNRPECDAFWEQIGEWFFTSYMSSKQCTFDTPGGGMVRPEGSKNLSCSGMTFIETWRRVPSGQLVGGTPNPYVLQKTGNLYPVPVQAFSTNTCFAVPCTDSSKPAGPSWSAIKEQISYTKKTDNQNINGA